MRTVCIFLSALAFALFGLNSCSRVISHQISNKEKHQYLALSKPISKQSRLLVIAGYYPNVQISKKQRFVQEETHTYMLHSLDLSGYTARTLMNNLTEQGYQSVTGYADFPATDLVEGPVFQKNYQDGYLLKKSGATEATLTKAAIAELQDILKGFPMVDDIILVKSKFDFTTELAPSTVITCGNDKTTMTIGYSVVIIDAKAMKVLAWKNDSLKKPIEAKEKIETSSKPLTVDVCEDIKNMPVATLKAAISQYYQTVPKAYFDTIHGLLTNIAVEK